MLRSRLASSGASSVKKILEGRYKQERSRSGYEDNITALYKEKVLSEFLSSADPVAFLEDTNRILIDEESAYTKLVIAQDLLNPEIRVSFQDIKVLGRKELKQLVSLHKKGAKIIDKCEGKVQENPVPKDATADTSIERETASDKLSMEAHKIIKNEKKKLLEKKAKARMRMQLQMNSTGDIENPYDISEFTGPKIEKSSPKDHTATGINEAPDKEEAGTEVWFSKPLFKKLDNAPVSKAKITPTKETADGAITLVPREEKHALDQDDRETLLSHGGLNVALNFAETGRKRRSRMIDESYNRYTFGDSTSLPDWFRERRK